MAEVSDCVHEYPSQIMYLGGNSAIYPIHTGYNMSNMHVYGQQWGLQPSTSLNLRTWHVRYLFEEKASE